jgi:hypothetical protein
MMGAVLFDTPEAKKILKFDSSTAYKSWFAN